MENEVYSREYNITVLHASIHYSVSYILLYFFKLSKGWKVKYRIIVMRFAVRKNIYLFPKHLDVNDA